jgi:hypothetical protein
VPSLFLAVSKPRWLVALAAIVLVSGAAMLPAMATMSDHGASLFSFEMAGSVARSQEIVTEWGSAGKAAMWWQLALDIPFLAGYGLFLAGACAAVWRQAETAGMPRLRKAASVAVWLGPVAAGADLLQNIGLAAVLAGADGQPWPRVSEVGGRITTPLMAAAAIFAIAGALATRRQVGPQVS